MSQALCPVAYLQNQMAVAWRSGCGDCLRRDEVTTVLPRPSQVAAWLVDGDPLRHERTSCPFALGPFQGGMFLGTLTRLRP